MFKKDKTRVPIKLTRKELQEPDQRDGKTNWKNNWGEPQITPTGGMKFQADPVATSKKSVSEKSDSSCDTWSIM